MAPAKHKVTAVDTGYGLASVCFDAGGDPLVHALE